VDVVTYLRSEACSVSTDLGCRCRNHSYGRVSWRYSLIDGRRRVTNFHS
jgi:hypothetical protein